MAISLDHIGTRVAVTDINVANGSFTINDGVNRHVGIVVWSHDPNPEGDHATYGGTALTQRVARDSMSGQGKRMEIWSLSDPPVGTATMHMEWTYNQERGAFIAFQLNGVKNSDPIKDTAGTYGLGSGASRVLDAGLGDFVIGGVIVSPDTASISLGTGQTDLDSGVWDNHDVRWRSSYEAGEEDGSTTHDYSWSGSYYFAIVACAFRKQVAGGPKLLLSRLHDFLQDLRRGALPPSELRAEYGDLLAI